MSVAPSSSISEAIRQRLAAIKEQTNTSPLSACSQAVPTSLETYIRLYNKCGRECYLNYMAGAKALAAYLAPIHIPSETDITFSKTLRKTALIHGYEVQQLAFIIARQNYPELEGTSAILSHVNYIENCIVYYTAKHIVEGYSL